jgi:hydroxymethylpyrimidine pyrophosphatase-like HAD family hydrolase
MEQVVQAIFLDIDETLISGESGPFEDDIREIEAARKRGHRVFLNTGRSFANIPRLIRNAPWVDGIVAGGGAHVLLANGGGAFRTIHHKWIPEALLLEICGLYFRIGKWCFFEGETELYEIKRDMGNLMIRNSDDFLVKYPGAVITKITMEGYADEDERALLADHFHLFLQTRYSEGIIKGESKSKGMGIILEETGIPRTRTIAIGDSLNDMDMIRFANTGVAMANACRELKEAADLVTLACGKGGVARVLRDL